MHSFPKNLKTIRLGKKLTQDALAEMLHVTRQTVSSWERGRSEPDLETLGVLAKTLEVRVEDLIYGPRRPASRTIKSSAILWTAVSFLVAATGLILEFTLFPHLDRLRITEYIHYAFEYRFALPQLWSLSWGIFFISILALWRTFPVGGRWRWVFWLSGGLLSLPGLLITLECLLSVFSPNSFYRLTRYVILYGYDTLRPLFMWIMPFLGGILVRLGFEKQN
ncbi:MAG: helix-turn-helix transcriptional regulator [Clostridia bacterium]|nr:helix-turn-helix transcriptional regulator [Clostridia bacterium]